LQYLIWTHIFSKMQAQALQRLSYSLVSIFDVGYQPLLNTWHT